MNSPDSLKNEELFIMNDKPRGEALVTFNNEQGIINVNTKAIQKLVLEHKNALNEISRLQTRNEVLEFVDLENGQLKIQLEDAQEDVERLRSALEFYAKAYRVTVEYSNYPESRSYETYEDNGKRAQQALSANQGEK